jgi:vacuolar-type H+-ATPase subunit I/STV1
VFTRKSAKGPTPAYCSASHRQRAYEVRRQARVAEKVLRQVSNLGLTESLAAFARPTVTSMFSDQLAALAQVQNASKLTESLAAFAQPTVASVVGSYLQRMAEPEFQSKFREQVESLAVVGQWDLDADTIEASLIDFAEAGVAPDEERDEQVAEVKPALLAASLLTIVIAHPQLTSMFHRKWIMAGREASRAWGAGSAGRWVRGRGCGPLPGHAGAPAGRPLR